MSAQPVATFPDDIENRGERESLRTETVPGSTANQPDPHPIQAPTSTYRLQINAEFDFRAATACIAYLKSLGIDCLYTSPYLQAAPGSTHGYDIVDHSTTNLAWGGESGRARMCEELSRHQMGQVIDVVPNHMAIGGRENPWWWDVLENGMSSRFAAFFDVDWDPPDRHVTNTLLLPILGDHYGNVITRGELKLARVNGEVLVQYYDRRLPVAPRSLSRILSHPLVAGSNCMVPFLADALGDLPAPTALDITAIQRRHRDRQILLLMLSNLLQENPTVASAVDQTLIEFNHDPAILHDFLDRQNYRITFWRVVSHDVGYRRFFDINTLVGLRAENEQVFAATHALILQWMANRVVKGLRVDHPDGLRDPTEYFERLRRACPSIWIVAEKILAPGEWLPDAWPVEGTTGYDFMNVAGGLFIDRRGEPALTEIYHEFSGERADFATIVRESKTCVLRESLGADINRLTGMLHSICEADWRYRDYTRHDAQEVLRATLNCLSVYRTYVRDGQTADRRSHERVSAAICEAKDMRADVDPHLFDLLERILLLQEPGRPALELALRFQQTSAAVTAKGVEDTAFYRYNRFIALNEVGGTPAHFGHSVEEFYAWCKEVERRCPLTMLATSTHDTKRSEDVRARLSVISELPSQWRNQVMRWSEHNEKYREDDLPDRDMEYHLYQTLVGAWPIEPERILSYAEKAAREAKRYTTWSSPNEKYERALAKFVLGITSDQSFLSRVAAFANELVEPGRINSLGLTLLKLTVPGVPDFYQGTELWCLSLVDSDNRRPVDYELRRRLLNELRDAKVDDVMRRSAEGLPKLWLIHHGLAVRSRHPEWFNPAAAFRPLQVVGPGAAHVIAFQRGDCVITVIPRLIARKRDRLADAVIELPAGDWENCLTGERWSRGPVAVGRILDKFPVAMLVCDKV